jgi:hypothetical protein
MDALASLSPLPSAAAASLLLLAVLFLCHGVASRLFPTAEGHVRLCATWVLSYWGMQVGFAVLGGLGLFQLPLVLMALVVACAAQSRWRRAGGVLGRLPADAADFGRRLRDLLSGAAFWAAGAVGVVLTLRLLRGTVAPPLGWDALTYHLFHAGQWVQSGAFTSQAGPDALAVYAHMPPGGDIVWAWAMLPFRSDFPIALAGGLVWLTIVSAAYGLGRTLGAEARASFVTALVLGATPAVMGFVASGYVDNVDVALVLLGSVFLARTLRELTVPDAAMAIAAFSSALCVKVSVAPFLVLATLAILAKTFGARRSAGLRVRVLGVCLAMGAAFAPFTVQTWIETGSPVFPWELKVGDWTVFEGMELVTTAAAGALTPETEFALPRFLYLLFVGPVRPGWPFMNLGAGFAVLLALGLAGVALAWRDPQRRWTGVLAVLFAGVVVGSLLSPGMLAMRTHWADTVGRLLVPGLAPLLVFGAIVPGRVPGALRLLAVLAGLALSLPKGWGPADRHHVLLAAAAVLSTVLLAWLVFRSSRQKLGRMPAAGLAALCVLLGILPLDAIRSTARYAIYEEVDRNFLRVYDPHPLGPWRDAWPIWRELDGEDPQRIALVAGWSQLGDNWFRYPLLGSRLQNDVVYIPPTKDGTIPDYRFPDDLHGRLDREAWLNRLLEAEVDHVVMLIPPPPELDWMLRDPRLFRPLRFGTARRSAAFRFDRDAAAARLGAAEGS